MKKTFVILLLCLLSGVSLQAWNNIGHAAVAQIASNHLTKGTRKALKKYLKGTDIVEIASYPDRYYYQWTRDLGWECSNPAILRRKGKALDDEPSNIEPWCHSYSVDSLFNTYRHNREGDAYVRNCIMDLDQIIRDIRENIDALSPYEQMKRIALVVHLVGDFHSPMHTLYVPAAPTGGKYSLWIDDEKINIHSFWDSKIWRYLNPGWDYFDFAKNADTATPAQIEEIVKGDIYDWGKASAIDAFPAHHLTGASEAQRHLGLDYPESLRPLVYNQLRNAGYRLAKLLNDLFDGR